MLIKIDKYNKGPGLWKINNTILKNEAYKRDIEALILDIWNNNCAQTPPSRFDYLKYKIQRITKQYCKDQAKKQKLKEKELLNELNILENRSSEATMSHADQLRQQELKVELSVLLEQKAQGLWIRSRTKQIEMYEKSNAFFHSIIKENHQKHTIVLLKTAQRETTDQKQILMEIKNFYKELYSTQFNSSISYESQRDKACFDHFTKFQSESSNEMETQLTLDELTKSLKQFSNNKTPGSDGLSKEFYETFWTLLGPILLQTFNYCFETGTLSVSQRKGVISLLHKKGKDKTKVENYRPISLLNTDYKILAKTIANRIEKQIGNIIHSDQIGFIKDRFIGEGIRKICDIMEAAEETTESGYVIQLDFKKAFDSIEWSFLFETLKQYNFGDIIIAWIKLLYERIESCVINGGYTSQWFELQKGLRQGCPLSAYLFLICAEILATSIRKNKKNRRSKNWER